MYPALLIANFFIRLAIQEKIYLSHQKLHQILYFAYGLYFAKNDQPLMDGRMETTKWGILFENVYKEYKIYGNDLPKKVPIEEFGIKIKKEDEAFMKEVWEAYKDQSPLILNMIITHKGSPWRQSRSWLDKLFGRQKPIKKNVLKDYFKELLEKGSEKEEYILCAAIWYKEIPLKKMIAEVLPKNCDRGIVVLGYRHGQSMWTMGSLTGLRSVANAEDGVGEYEQGFLTNKNRFVNREEAAKIALAAGQIKKLNYSNTELYSEDLY